MRANERELAINKGFAVVAFPMLVMSGRENRSSSIGVARFWKICGDMSRTSSRWSNDLRVVCREFPMSQTAGY
jgi:hypothetical protein